MTDQQQEPSTSAEPATDPQGAAPAETDWKAEARKWEQRSKENSQKLKDAEPILTQWEQLQQASKTELERATEEATRWQSEAEKWRSTSVASRIQALASTDYADPSDAVSALSDPAKYLGAGGEIDDAAIQTDLAAVLDKKPHWRRQEGSSGPRMPAPNPAQGSGGKPAATNPADEFAALIQQQIRGS